MGRKIITSEHDESLDYEEEDFDFNDISIMERIIFRGYRETIGRGITTFDWQIGSGNAMLQINKVSKRDYKSIGTSIMESMSNILDNVDFEWLDIRPIIPHLDCLATFDDDIEVIVPRRDVPTRDGNTIALLNRFQQNISEDSDMADVQERQRGVTGRSKVDLRWKPRGKMDFRVELMAEIDDDQRIGINAQRSEKEIRDVVRGIRSCL